MKRIGTLFVLALLLASLLAGCIKESSTATYTVEDLTITLPADFIDLSDEEFASELAFVYGLDPIAVNGLRETKTTFAAYGLDIDLERYGQLLISSNNVQAKLEWQDDIPYFTHTSDEFTYVVTLWETDNAFWVVQAYCPTTEYNRVKADIWKILASVTV